jgi:hypothetical protein
VYKESHCQGRLIESILKSNILVFGKMHELETADNDIIAPSIKMANETQ